MSTSIALTSPVVSVEWLQRNLHAENLIILDGTINKVFIADQKQIPNTRFFDIKNKFFALCPFNIQSNPPIESICIFKQKPPVVEINDGFIIKIFLLTGVNADVERIGSGVQLL